LLPRVSRFASFAVLGLLVGAAACAHPGAPAPLATPVAQGSVAAADSDLAAVTDPDSLAALASGADDSAADEAALAALDALQFRSLGTNERVSGGARYRTGDVSPRDVTDERARIFEGSHGGAASAAAPTYDIDVASFANHERVQYYIDYFQNEARDRFTIWLGRLQRYQGMIRARLHAQGVPEDLVYLAMIESGYSNTAVSPARAVGMWQFIAGTGRHYGLRSDAWVDERRDPFRATDAAARYLATLDSQFGSWYLAAAAYNAGAGRVFRGIERLPNASDSLTDDTFFELYDTRYLRRETKDYVPKLIAAALIAKNPSRYGFDSIPALKPLVYDEVSVTGATGLDVLARLADTTTAALVELNPQFIRGVTPPARTVIVRVPRGTGDEVAQRWAALPTNERVSFLEHRIARGETLSEIGHRYGVSVSLLLAANHGLSPRRLRVGHRLVIPVSHAARRAAAAGRAPQPRRVEPNHPTTSYYTVRRGDSLWTIARLYGVQISELRGWNGIRRGQVLRVGEQLRVRAPGRRASR